MIANLYSKIYKFREKSFGFDIKYNFLPKEICKVPLVIMLDAVWFLRGFTGRNKCFVADGKENSKRFDNDSKYFQAWIGTYSLTKFLNPRFKNSDNMVRYLSKAAIADQEAWLLIYGCKHFKTRLIASSMEFVAERDLNGFKQTIYKGEMFSGIDNPKKHYKLPRFFRDLSTKVAEKYSNVKLSKDFLECENCLCEGSDRIRLDGYFSVIQVSKRKFLITYACGTKENFKNIEKDLLKTIENIEVVKF